MSIYDSSKSVIADNQGFIWVTVIVHVQKGLPIKIKQQPKKIVSLKSLNDLKVTAVCPLGSDFGSCIDL